MLIKKLEGPSPGMTLRRRRPGTGPATFNAHRHLPNVSLLSSKREKLAWRGHHGFKEKDKWRF